MDRPHAVISSTAAAAALVVVRPILALADTGTPPTGGDAVVGQSFDPSGPLALALLLAVVLGTVLVALRRPGSRRPLAAIAAIALAGAIALVFIFAGLFSDWSGQHRVSVIPVVIGIGVLVLGISVAAGILRRPRDG